MSQYIDFVLKRAGVPKPNTIWVVEHKLSWINQQIQDEFKVIYSNANLYFNFNITEIDSLDLIVLPFMWTFSKEYFGKKQLFSQLRSSVDLWAMLYGVKYRVIYVMSASQLLSFFRKDVVIDKIWSFANKTRSSRIVSKLSNLP